MIPGNNCVISGTSRVVRPVGLMVDEMTVRPEGGLKICISPKTGKNRMTQMTELRNAFLSLDRHIDEVAERRYGEEQEKAGKKVLVGPDEAAEEGKSLLSVDDLDQQWRTLYRLQSR